MHIYNVIIIVFPAIIPLQAATILNEGAVNTNMFWKEALEGARESRAHPNK